MILSEHERAKKAAHGADKRLGEIQHETYTASLFIFWSESLLLFFLRYISSLSPRRRCWDSNVLRHMAARKLLLQLRLREMCWREWKFSKKFPKLLWSSFKKSGADWDCCNKKSKSSHYWKCDVKFEKFQLLRSHGCHDVLNSIECSFSRLSPLHLRLYAQLSYVSCNVVRYQTLRHI